MNTPLLVLTDAEFQRVVIKNGQVLQRFPWLVPVKTAADALAGCSSCQAGSKKKLLNERIAAAKSSIVSMSQADKAEFKRLLGVNAVRVFHVDTSRQPARRERYDF